MKKRCMPFCHSLRSFVSEVVSIKRNKNIGEEKQAKQPQVDKKEEKVYERGLLRTKGLLTLHTFLKKRKKQLQIIITRRVVLMSQFNDDEERKTLQKRQRRQEDIVMRGNIDPQ